MNTDKPLETRMLISRNDGSSVCYKISGEASGDEIADIFRLIMKWMTYADETIDEFIPSEESMESIKKDIENMVRSEFNANKRTKKP